MRYTSYVVRRPRCLNAFTCRVEKWLNFHFGNMEKNGRIKQKGTTDIGSETQKMVDDKMSICCETSKSSTTDIENANSEKQRSLNAFQLLMRANSLLPKREASSTKVKPNSTHLPFFGRI